jgi:hypothetical protein
LLFGGHLKMAIKVRGGVMSINGPANTVAAIEVDMRDLLRAKKARHSDPSKEPGSDYSYLVSQMSGQSVYEIDHLIEGLQGVREKLNGDGDRLHREILQYTAFSQSIIELTKIVSDGMAFVNKSVTAVATPKNVA